MFEQFAVPSNTRKSRRIGFTLIELLVVISIIAILAAILFPVFARARENARRASCQSNLKQIGLGMMQYSQDYDEKLPPGNDTVEHVGCGWGGQLFPYIKSSQIFTCPSDSFSPTIVGNATISYGYNSAIPDITPGYGINGAIAQFNATAKTVLLFEVQGYEALVNNPEGYGSNVTPAGSGLDTKIWVWNFEVKGAYATGLMGGRAGTIGSTGGHFLAQNGRHLEGSNFLMVDGHVKWLKGSNVSSGWQAASPASAPTSDKAAGTEAPGFAVTFSPT